MYRCIFLREKSAQNYILVSLSFADILTSIYLLMLTTVDLMYRGSFSSISFFWKKSGVCQVMAILSALSANVSLILLVLLALYRCFHIVYGLVLGRLQILSPIYDIRFFVVLSYDSEADSDFIMKVIFWALKWHLLHVSMTISSQDIAINVPKE